MKLAAIYNVWDGVELLEGSIDCIRKHVDVIIIVYQRTSNFGERFDPFPYIQNACLPFGDIEYLAIEHVPAIQGGATNEKAKRNIGLDLARAKGCTHFLHMDCDEYYKNFAEAKQMYIDSGRSGSVCKLFTYFKSPTYRFKNPDGYFVPFIHKLKPDTIAGFRPYPFYVDPTRSINETDVIELPIFMHHFSWVRENIEMKCRNSSARKNIEKGTALEDYNSCLLQECAENYYVKDFNQHLTVVENYFNINLNDKGK